jgi:hypothetical protein
VYSLSKWSPTRGPRRRRGRETKQCPPKYRVHIFRVFNFRGHLDVAATTRDGCRRESWIMLAPFPVECFFFSYCSWVCGARMFLPFSITLFATFSTRALDNGLDWSDGTSKCACFRRTGHRRNYAAISVPLPIQSIISWRLPNCCSLLYFSFSVTAVAVYPGRGAWLTHGHPFRKRQNVNFWQYPWWIFSH